MPNYENSKIYVIKSHKTEKVYIGSTTQTLNKRFIQHKHDALKIYSCKSKELFQYDDTYIELIENYPCKTIEELHARETEIMKTTPHLINKVMPGIRTINPDEKEKDKERHKIFREKIKQAKRLGITLPPAKIGRPIKVRSNTETTILNHEIIKLRAEKDDEINLLKQKNLKIRKILVEVMKDRNELMKQLLILMLDNKILKLRNSA